MAELSGVEPDEAAAADARGCPVLPSPQEPAPGPSTRLCTHSDILNLIVQNASLPDILQVITALVEREISGARASILLLDEDGLHLQVGAGPSLPAEYNTAIGGALIGPNTGACGTAAYEKRVVITASIADDPAWDAWRPAAEAARLAACWSTPFLGLHNRVLGTFAVYFDHPRDPQESELALLHDAGYLAAVAVQHDHVRRLLRETARTNPLTGMPNRIVLIEQLRAAEADAAETGQRFAVIQIGVDGMAPINESLGLSVGDAVLRIVAERLTALFGDSGHAAHLWGCDFAVLVDALGSDDEALAVAEKLRDALAEPLEVEGMSLVVGVIMGLAVYGREVLDGPRPIDEPLRTANVAMERAKAGGNQQIGVYDAKSDPGADVILLGHALRRGIDEEELTLAYQPVVTLAEDRVDHYEALLRWNTAQGIVPPDSFVPVAEQTGLVGDMGRYALRRALAELALWRARGEQAGVSVNLSVRQLSDERLPDVIAELIAEYALPAECVTLEVTEGVMLTTSAVGWDVLNRIRDVGARISLDDFGTGFSQINYLRRFRFDELKIDRTFVRDMDHDVAARAIIVGVIAFAREAGMTIVAEGIEHRRQADWLRELGCTHGQGYLFGAARPEPTG
ncbi:MAG: GGDEF domain-containing protein [Jatrophihabitantaceae bacterium]